MPFKENRVYVKDFSSLSAASELLIAIPTTKGHKQQYIHKAVLSDFLLMSAAVKNDLNIELLVASGWRPPLWTTIKAYEKDMILQYGSVEKGRIYRAFQSAHQTGLALDLGCGGLSPNSKTIKKQKTTKLYKWLVKNAYKYGWTPFLRESWHFEHKISLAAFKTGVPDNQTLGPVYPESNYCDEYSCVEVPDESN